MAGASHLIEEIDNLEKMQKIVMDAIKQPGVVAKSDEKKQLIASNGDNYTSEDMETGFEETDEPYDPESDLQATEFKPDSLNSSQEANVAPLKSNNSSAAKANVEPAKKDVESKIVSAAKNAIRPFYMGKQIDKDEYKNIMKKVVNKVRFLLNSLWIFFCLILFI